MHNCLRKKSINRGIQNGVIVLVCLVFLLVFSAIALAGMEVTILEERMAGTVQDQNRAFQAAEISLAAAQSWLNAQKYLPSASDKANGGSPVVWARDAAGITEDTEPWWLEREPNWWQQEATAVTGVLSVHTQPYYIIEEYLNIADRSSLNVGDGETAQIKTLYRITARGWGGDSNNQVLLQVIYARSYE